MKNTIKPFIIGLAALSAIAAQANTGVLISWAVFKGDATGVGADMARADNNLYRIKPKTFTRDFGFSVTFSRLGNPNLVRRLEISVRGQSPGFHKPNLYLFDFVAQRYELVKPLDLPGPGLSDSIARVRKNPGRFVSSGGLLRFFVDGESLLILDQIAVRAVQ